MKSPDLCLSVLFTTVIRLMTGVYELFDYFDLFCSYNLFKEITFSLLCLLLKLLEKKVVCEPPFCLFCNNTDVNLCSHS